MVVLLLLLSIHHPKPPSPLQLALRRSFLLLARLLILRLLLLLHLLILQQLLVIRLLQLFLPTRSLHLGIATSCCSARPMILVLTIYTQIHTVEHFQTHKARKLVPLKHVLIIDRIRPTT